MERVPRSIEALVEYQVKRWSAEHARRPPGQERWPVITISREYGARGGALARAVAERMHFTVWDKEIVAAIANESSVSEGFVATLDEQRKGAIAAIFNAFVKQAPLGDAEYLRQLMRIVHTVGQHGAAVIVGRGAHYILNRDPVLRVRVIASMELRVKEIAERRGVDAEAAETAVRVVDTERRDFVRLHYKRSIEDVHDFDLVLSGDAFDLEAMTEIVVQAYHSRFGRPPAAEATR